MTIQQVRDIALAFDEVVEMPHFEKTSFRVRKKIFLTLDIKKSRACLKLSEVDQNVFSLIDKSVIYPVPNKWGKQGWTFVELKKVKNQLFKDALAASYCEVAPASLASKFNRVH